MELAKVIARELKWSLKGTTEAIRLLEEGNTIPFIARYRKEATGEMDEEKLRLLEQRLEYLKNLAGRKEEILRLIKEQEKLTPELEEKIKKCTALQQLEDIYRPYRPKRRTRASIAKEQGLEPLALYILDQTITEGDIWETAAQFINAEAGINSAEAALQGAKDIIAEKIADDPASRELIRNQFHNKGKIITAGSSEEPTPYEMYYTYEEPLISIPPHRILAINRGEKEKVLTVKIGIPEEEVIEGLIAFHTINPQALGIKLIAEAAADGAKRLLFPSIERELRNILTEKGEEQAIKVFAQNLRSLLLQQPVKGQVIMGVDPGFRTGCKIAVVNETGKLLEVAVIYPHPPQNKKAESREIITELIEKWHVNSIAIGNGTASRETEQFIALLIKEKELAVQYTIASEVGASVYSASPLAAKEFPDLDLTYRSGISIARRLQDPLAELVKIDPKSVGVGQYQHDIKGKKLNQALDVVVESCVNTVGVELNTASASLLQHVAGLSPSLAESIVSLRDRKGSFLSREELLEVSRLGAQTFEQCSGFIRIRNGKNPLDNTPVHPESYQLAEKILAEAGFSLTELRTHHKEIKESLEGLDVAQIAQRLNAGEPTVRDIINCLKRPGRDPREDLPPVLLRQDVMGLDDLETGMRLRGTVRNVVDFGAFVDIGVKQDGLIHISQLSEKYIKHPLEVIAVGDVVNVAVMGVDKERERISLTMRGVEQ